MREEITYIANDGSRFENKNQCILYENSNDVEQFLMNENNRITICSALYERLGLDNIESTDKKIVLENANLKLSIYTTIYNDKPCIGITRWFDESSAVMTYAKPFMEDVLFAIIEALGAPREED